MEQAMEEEEDMVVILNIIHEEATIEIIVKDQEEDREEDIKVTRNTKYSLEEFPKIFQIVIYNNSLTRRESSSTGSTIYKIRELHLELVRVSNK